LSRILWLIIILLLLIPNQRQIRLRLHRLASPSLRERIRRLDITPFSPLACTSSHKSSLMRDAALFISVFNLEDCDCDDCG